MNCAFVSKSPSRINFAHSIRGDLCKCQLKLLKAPLQASMSHNTTVTNRLAWNYHRDMRECGISSCSVINNLRSLLIDIVRRVYNSLRSHIVTHNYFDTVRTVKSFDKIYHLQILNFIFIFDLKSVKFFRERSFLKIFLFLMLILDFLKCVIKINTFHRFINSTFRSHYITSIKKSKLKIIIRYNFLWSQF